MINCLPVRDLTTDELKAEVVAIFRAFAIAELTMLQGGFVTAMRANRFGYDGAKTKPEFFLGRLGYLVDRLAAVKAELDRRKDEFFANMVFSLDKFQGILPPLAWGDWKPTLVDYEANRQDILAQRKLNMAG